MGNFLDEFMGSMGGDVSNQISGKLGINKNTVKQVLPQVIPMILGGLKKQKDEYGGEARVDHILNKYGSASTLDNLDELFSTKAKEQNPDPNLGGLLGNSGSQAVNMLSNQFNLDSGSLSKLIPMLAPVVLGFLTKKRDSGGVGSSGISALLDQDGDGSILDDVAGFLMGGSGQSGKSATGNLVSSLLGNLFGKKR